MKVELVEKILKREVTTENKKRAKNLANGYSEKYNQPITYVDALNMHWQSRNKIFKDCNGNCTFDPVLVQAHSYDHWRFVDVIKGKVVFNDYRYSNTTSGHQWRVRYLLEQLGIKIDLEVQMYESLTTFKENALIALYRQLADYEIKLNRKLSKEKTKNYMIALIKEVKTKIKAVKKLEAVITKEQIENIKFNCEQAEIRRLNYLKNERLERLEIAKACKVIELNNKVFDIESLIA